MELESSWKKVGEGKDDLLSALLAMPLISKLPSKDPLEKIRRAILINACWGLLIGSGYIFVLLRWPAWPIIACLGIGVVFLFMGVAKTLVLYKDLGKPADGYTLLQEMERHYHAIRRWIHLQQWGNLLLLPFYLTAGVLLGWGLGSGQPIGEIIQKPRFLITLLVLIAVAAPLYWVLAKWMSQKAFGQVADRLKENIDALKNEL